MKAVAAWWPPRSCGFSQRSAWVPIVFASSGLKVSCWSSLIYFFSRRATCRAVLYCSSYMLLVILPVMMLNPRCYDRSPPFPAAWPSGLIVVLCQGMHHGDAEQHAAGVRVFCLRVAANLALGSCLLCLALPCYERLLQGAFLRLTCVFAWLPWPCCCLLCSHREANPRSHYGFGCRVRWGLLHMVYAVFRTRRVSAEVGSCHNILPEWFSWLRLIMLFLCLLVPPEGEGPMVLGTLLVIHCCIITRVGSSFMFLQPYFCFRAILGPAGSFRLNDWFCATVPISWPWLVVLESDDQFGNLRI